MKRTVLFSTAVACLAWVVPAFAGSVILPHRVIDCRTRTVIDFEGLLARCSRADVVALGENHDDPATHLVELALLEGLNRHNRNVVLSMEMFERDVQEYLDRYLEGEMTEDEFLGISRPWENYETDYRPLVEFARNNSLPVVASNVPRRLAGQVARGGIEGTEFAEDDLGWVSSVFEAPEDAYWEAFAATMHMPGMERMAVTEENIRWYYEAQVLKDETMAESIARAATASPGALVYHLTGSFHVQDYLGTFSRVRRDLPEADCVSILAIPVDELLSVPPQDTPSADYWILVLAPPGEEVEGPEVMPDSDRLETEDGEQEE